MDISEPITMAPELTILFARDSARGFGLRHRRGEERIERNDEHPASDRDAEQREDHQARPLGETGSSVAS